MRQFFLALFCLATLSSGCAEGGHGPLVSSGERYPTAQSGVPDYRLDIGDRVRITVFGEATLSGEYAVSANGMLPLPLIGEVPAKGRVVGEVVEEARVRLADGFLRTPRVSGEVTTYRPFYVLGEVSRPGPYPYVVGLTVLNAIATAQGFTPRADHEVVRIRRQGATEEVTYRLTQELVIYPGDTIRIGERFF